MTNVSFLTGDCITLSPEFEVVLGAEFLAQTNMPCSQISLMEIVDRSSEEAREKNMISQNNHENIMKRGEITRFYV